MGMFDSLEWRCPNCGAIDEVQSTLVRVAEVDNA